MYNEVVIVQYEKWAKAHFFIAINRTNRERMRVPKTQEGIVEKSGLIEKVTAIVNQAGTAAGIEAVEVQWLGGGGSRLLRIFIDKPQGVTLEDCETISQGVSAALDEQDAIPGGHYQLQVSSPGVERKLSKPKDFERFSGQKVKIVLRDPLSAGTSKLFEGTIAGFEQGLITLQPAKGDPIHIPLSQVDRANLKFEW